MSSVTIARAEVHGLLPHQLHQFGAVDAVLLVRHVHVRQRSGGNGGVEILLQFARRKAGVILDLGGQVELAQRQRAVEPFSSVIAPSNTSGCSSARAA